MTTRTNEFEINQHNTLLIILQERFEQHMERHKGLHWKPIQERLEANPRKLWSLNEMESTGGEPDVIGLDEKTGSYVFVDCVSETPKGRRSLCYDRAALESRKAHKPVGSAKDIAAQMNVDLLTEEQYLALQQLGTFDTKTSSWLETPADVRNRGGALFGDRRFGRVFIYHNGADSYYAARGFRSALYV